ncbi:unnamed protein product [Orchesella dallaii]|uniref:Uncharacterized protein n=1 Tax=Orchesella dallaii TaxID=48710 RepID=A0ABP1S3G4_9HEXA
MIRLIILIDFATTIIDNVQCEVQSDSYSYSDEVYSQLAAEYEQYQDDLPMPAGYKAAEAKLDNSASKSIADEYLSTAGLSYSLYWYKMRKRKHLDNLRKKYLPGRIELPNGKIGIYEPTAEEEDAYEDLIKVLIVQEVIARS